MQTLSRLLTDGSEVGHLWGARIGGDVFCAPVSSVAALYGAEEKAVRSMLCCYCKAPSGDPLVSLLDISMVSLSEGAAGIGQRLATTHRELLKITQDDVTVTPALIACIRKHKAAAREAVRICEGWSSSESPDRTMIDSLLAAGDRLRRSLQSAAGHLPPDLAARFPTILPLSLFMFYLAKPKNLGLTPPQACLPPALGPSPISVAWSDSRTAAMSREEAAVLIQATYKGSNERARFKRRTQRKSGGNLAVERGASLPPSPALSPEARLPGGVYSGAALPGSHSTALQVHLRRTAAPQFSSVQPKKVGRQLPISPSPPPHLPFELEAGSPLPSISPPGEEAGLGCGVVPCDGGLAGLMCTPVKGEAEAGVGVGVLQQGSLPPPVVFQLRNVSPGRPVRRSVDERVADLLKSGERLREDIARERVVVSGMRYPMANITNNVADVSFAVPTVPTPTLPGSPQSIPADALRRPVAVHPSVSYSLNASRSPLAPVPPFFTEAVVSKGMPITSTPMYRSTSEPMRPVPPCYRPPPSPYAASALRKAAVAEQIWESPGLQPSAAQHAPPAVCLTPRRDPGARGASAAKAKRRQAEQQPTPTDSDSSLLQEPRSARYRQERPRRKMSKHSTHLSGMSSARTSSPATDGRPPSPEPSSSSLDTLCLPVHLRGERTRPGGGDGEETSSSTVRPEPKPSPKRNPVELLALAKLQPKAGGGDAAGGGVSGGGSPVAVAPHSPEKIPEQKVTKASWINTDMRGRARPRIDIGSTLLRDAATLTGPKSASRVPQTRGTAKGPLPSFTLAPSGSGASSGSKSSPPTPTDPPTARRPKPPLPH